MTEQMEAWMRNAGADPSDPEVKEYGDKLEAYVQNFCRMSGIPVRVFMGSSEPTFGETLHREQLENEEQSRKRWEQFGRDYAEYIELTVLEKPIPERLAKFKARAVPAPLDPKVEEAVKGMNITTLQWEKSVRPVNLNPAPGTFATQTPKQLKDLTPIEVTAKYDPQATLNEILEMRDAFEDFYYGDDRTKFEQAWAELNEDLQVQPIIVENKE